MNIPDRNGQPMKTPPRPSLAKGRVRFVGEAVACVVAETAVQAKDAAETVVLDIEELPAVTTPADALKPGAPRIHEEAPGNLVLDFHYGDAEAVKKAFAEAAHVTRLEIASNRIVVSAMEPRSAIGSYESPTGRWTLHVGCQGVMGLRGGLARDVLGVTPDKVSVLVMDTDLTPNGGPTTASRQTFVTGNASRYAAKTLRDQISASMAEKYDVRPEQIRFEDGVVHVNGHSMTYAEIYKEMTAAGQKPCVRYEYEAPKTQPLGTGGDMHFAFSFATQAAQIELNKLTGEVNVLKVISANDVGMAINPLGLQGQVEGGVMMGLGHCLTEEFIVENGQVVTDHLARYRVPGIMLTPEITSIIVEHPVEAGPFGAKGVGEVSSIPTIPAITNAIYNAVGVRVDKLPVDQEMIARELWEREGK